MTQAKRSQVQALKEQLNAQIQAAANTPEHGLTIGDKVNVRLSGLTLDQVSEQGYTFSIHITPDLILSVVLPDEFMDGAIITPAV